MGEFYHMKSCNLVLLCSSSTTRTHGKSEMNFCTQREALSREALHRYRMTSLNTTFGHLSPLKSIALSTDLEGFAPKALLIPPDTTTAAISAAGMFRDSTKPRALWPKDGPGDNDVFDLLGPFPLIALTTIHRLLYKFHHLSLKSSFAGGCFRPRRSLEIKKKINQRIS